MPIRYYTKHNRALLFFGPIMQMDGLLPPHLSRYILRYIEPNRDLNRLMMMMMVCANWWTMGGITTRAQTRSVWVAAFLCHVACMQPNSLYRLFNMRPPREN